MPGGERRRRAQTHHHRAPHLQQCLRQRLIAEQLLGGVFAPLPHGRVLDDNLFGRCAERRTTATHARTDARTSVPAAAFSAALSTRLAAGRDASSGLRSSVGSSRLANERCVCAKTKTKAK